MTYIILILVTLWIFYEIRQIKRALIVSNFSDRVVSRLLVRKGLINESEIDIATNELIGDMLPEVGDKVIKSAQKMGINIPEYMDEENLKKYVDKKEAEREYRRLSNILDNYLE